jgi:hypothetical protein
MALVSPHDSLRQQKIPEKSCHHQILPEKLLEKRTGQSIPRNGIGDGGEYPIQFAQRTSSVLQTSRNLEFFQFETDVQGIL